jgi:hypothetical protein
MSMNLGAGAVTVIVNDRSGCLSGQRAIGQDCVGFASVLNEYLSGLRDQTIVTRKAILPVMVIW